VVDLDRSFPCAVVIIYTSKVFLRRARFELVVSALLMPAGERAMERAGERALERAGERALERAGGQIKHAQHFINADLSLEALLRTAAIAVQQLAVSA
jgi:hypothetical protein